MRDGCQPCAGGGLMQGLNLPGLSGLPAGGTIDVPEGQPVEAIAPTVAKLVADKSADVVLVEPTRRMKVVAGKLSITVHDVLYNLVVFQQTFA